MTTNRHGVRVAYERRRGEVQRAQRVEGTNYRCEGMVEIHGVGEVGPIEVPFPVVYIERPILAFGADFGDWNTALTDGYFPAPTGCVWRWVTKPRPDNPDQLFYVGAELIYVLDSVPGDTEMPWYGTWVASGTALVNPVREALE